MMMASFLSLCFVPASSWSEVGPSPPSTVLSLTIALKPTPEGEATLERLFHEVSNPQHGRYQKYLTQERVLALLTPKQASITAVTTFLSKHGAAFGEIQGNLISATMTVAQAETAFRTHIFAQSHEHMCTELHRASVFAIPQEIGGAVSAIDGLTSLPRVRSAAAASPPPPALRFPVRTCGGACPGLVTPAILSTRYGLGAPPVTFATNNSMSVSSFMFESWDQSDLTQFGTACKTLPIEVDAQIGKNGREPGQEALLDIEYIKALGGAIPLTDISQMNYQLLDWAKTLMAMDNPPLVNSVSYETDESQQTSPGFMDACNTQFKALALRGLSLLFATGDQGVCGRSGCGPIEPFHPGFPSTSPYVTSVGATDFAVASEIGDERAWGSSGGGFSNHFPIPSWQRAGVAAYKIEAASTLPPPNLWNNSGRGIPDVSALGGQSNPFCVHYKGQSCFSFFLFIMTEYLARYFSNYLIDYKFIYKRSIPSAQRHVCRDTRRRCNFCSAQRH